MRVLHESGPPSGAARRRAARRRPAAALVPVLALLAAGPARAGDGLQIVGGSIPIDVRSDQTVTAGDLDGDGDLDLVVGSISGLEVYTNDGAAVFTSTPGAGIPLSGPAVFDLAIADVTGDARPDVLVARQPLGLYVNLGGGTFTDASANFPSLSSLWEGLTVLDADGDQDLDVALAAFGAQNRLLDNDGTGVFTDVTVARLPADTDPSQDVLAADTDGDLDPDLLFPATSISPTLHYRNDAGIFTNVSAGTVPLNLFSGSAAEAFDADGDQDLDLAIAESSANTGSFLWINQGGSQAGTEGVYADETSSRLPPMSDQTFDAKAGDVDGDGDQDLLWANAFGQDLFFANDGAGVFTDVTAARFPPDGADSQEGALFDADGDGDPDLYVAVLNQQDRLYRNVGGTFQDSTNPGFPSDTDPAEDVEAGDFDGDGDLDLFFVNAGFSGFPEFLYANDGHGVYTKVPGAVPAFLDFTEDAGAADIDGDQDLDVGVVNSGATLGEINRIYRNQGGLVFVEAAPLPPHAQPSFDGDFADIDGDNDPDFIVSNQLSTNRVYVNDGTGVFSTWPNLPPDGVFTEDIDAGDVDGDGDLDLVAGNFGQNVLYRNTGGGVFVDDTAGNMLPNADSTFDVALADVDGDQDLDLYEANGQTFPSTLALNDGTGTFTDASGTHLPGVVDQSSQDTDFFDYDGDGDLDLFASIFGPNRLLANDGSGHFSDLPAGTITAGQDFSENSAVGDLDGDGDLDLVMAQGHGTVGQQNRIYKNTRAHLNEVGLSQVGLRIQLQIHGRPGELFLLLLGLAPGSTPVPPYGTLKINPVVLLTVQSGVIPGSGSTPFSLGLPNNPALPGLTFYWQALVADLTPPDPGRFTNLVATTVLDA